MKRFVTLLTLLCSACLLLTSCTFVPDIGLIMDGWDVMLEELLEETPDPDEDFGAGGDFDVTPEEDYDPDTYRGLEEKYGIDIDDPDDLLTPENCAILDESLTILSEPVIDGILDYLEQNGRDFSIVFLDESYDALGETTFTFDEVEIAIYAPRKTYDDEMTNGITVETIVHEFGHVLHDILEDECGARAVSDLWLSLNGPYDYGDEWDESCDRYFAYDYGMTDYYEDVATIYEDLAAYPTVTESRLGREENEPLYLKAKYLYELTDDCFDLSESTLFDPYLSAREERGDYESFEESLEAYLGQEPSFEPYPEDDFAFDFDFDLFDDFFAEFGSFGFDVDLGESYTA